MHCEFTVSLLWTARRRVAQKWVSAGPFGTTAFPYLRMFSFLSGPAPASRVASGERHGGQRPALKILESFGGVAAWASLLASVHGVGLVQQRNKPFPFF